jgi:hypothetical protein
MKGTQRGKGEVRATRGRCGKLDGYAPSSEIAALPLRRTLGGR